MSIRTDAKLANDWNLSNVKKVPTRNGFGDGLLIAGERNKDVVALCADLTESTRVQAFAEKFPERFVQIGVAEQNMATVASGMAAAGKIPFIASYAMFSPGRNWEQIRTTIAYNDRNVKIAGAHAGISVGPDGATHQALEDISIMRVMPNMTVLVPCDAIEARKITIAAAQHHGPVYFRFAREKTPVFTTDETPFSIGKAVVFRDGNDAAIVACGPLVYEALLAAETLSKENINCTVINSPSIKPLDGATIVGAAKRCGAVVTAEEAQYVGGLGGAVAELLSEAHPVPIKRVGVKDHFGESGEAEELLTKFGLRAVDIIKAVREAIAMKNNPRASLAKHTTLNKNEYFKLANGKQLTSLVELRDALASMDNATYAHHVHTNRNDFATWVNDVFHHQDLAHQMRTSPTKQQLTKTIARHCKQ